MKLTGSQHQKLSTSTYAQNAITRSISLKDINDIII